MSATQSAVVDDLGNINVHGRSALQVVWKVKSAEGAFLNISASDLFIEIAGSVRVALTAGEDDYSRKLSLTRAQIAALPLNQPLSYALHDETPSSAATIWSGKITAYGFRAAPPGADAVEPGTASWTGATVTVMQGESVPTVVVTYMGATGYGIPIGGTVGQYIRKASATNFDVEWDTITADDVSGLSASLSTLTSADVSLTSRISTEEATRATADTSLTTRLSTEETARGSGDVSLTSRVSTEETARGSADTSIVSRFSTADVSLATADTSLTTRLSTEEVTRASVDTSLATVDVSLSSALSTQEANNLAGIFGIDLDFANERYAVNGSRASTVATIPGITFTRATTAMFYGSNGLLQTAGSGVARLSYDPVTLASQGILVEEARTNLCLYSSDLTNAAWVKQTTTAAKTATGPDGAVNSATTLTATSANAYTKQNITSASAARTTSTFIKRRTGSGVVTLSHGDTTGADLVVNGDFSSDTVWVKGTGWSIGAGAATFVGGTPEYLKQNGIITVGTVYKVTFTVTAIVGAASVSVYFGNSPSSLLANALGTYSVIGVCQSTTLGLAFRGNSSDGATSISIDDVSMLEVVQTTATVTPSWTRVATPTATITDPVVGIRLETSGDEVDVAFVQCEAGTGASSPIPTTTAAVTRAADVAAVTGLTVAAPLTMVSSGAAALLTPATKYMAQLDAGTQNNVVLNYLSGTMARRAYVTASGVAQADVAAGAQVAVGDQWTMAGLFQTNNVNAAASGTLGTADTSATMPSGLVNLRIGSTSVGAAQFNGTISRIRIYNRALTNAELQAVTT